MSPRAAEGHRIVVGVDGSDSSRTALAWAVRQAELTGATIDAVTAWHIPAYYGIAGGDQGTNFEQIAATLLQESIAQAQPLAPEVVIRPVIVHDNAPRALLAAAKDAELLVVGSRGHGGFAEALLGSVGQHCVHHADCPVVVVRSPHGPPRTLN
jgi:nucleotide-binding universal stress UspA family protein